MSQGVRTTRRGTAYGAYMAPTIATATTTARSSFEKKGVETRSPEEAFVGGIKQLQPNPSLPGSPIPSPSESEAGSIYDSLAPSGAPSGNQTPTQQFPLKNVAISTPLYPGLSFATPGLRRMEEALGENENLKGEVQKLNEDLNIED